MNKRQRKKAFKKWYADYENKGKSKRRMRMSIISSEDIPPEVKKRLDETSINTLIYGNVLVKFSPDKSPIFRTLSPEEVHKLTTDKNKL